MEADGQGIDPFDRATARIFSETIGEIGRWTETGALQWIVDNPERFTIAFWTAARNELSRRGLL